MKRIISLLVTLALAAALLPGWTSPAQAAEQTGTTDWSQVTAFTWGESYYISSLEDLKAFRDLVNSASGNTNDLLYGYSCTFYLTADIVMNDPEVLRSAARRENGRIRSMDNDALAAAKVERWEPIGNEKPYSGSPTGFMGVFDGQGHTITGLYCYYKQNENGYAGLFGNIAGHEYRYGENGITKTELRRGGVRNLNLRNAYVTRMIGRQNVSTEVYNKAGAIAAYVEGWVDNCTVADSFVAVYGLAYGDQHDRPTVGGIAAECDGGSITNCRVDATLLGEIVGGITACAARRSELNAGYTTSIYNCVTGGTYYSVTENYGSGISAYACIGGLISYNQNGTSITVMNCGSTASLDAPLDISKPLYLGGLAGSLSASVTFHNCWFAGKIDNGAVVASIATVGASEYNSGTKPFDRNDYGKAPIQFCYVPRDAATFLFHFGNGVLNNKYDTDCGVFDLQAVKGGAPATLYHVNNTGSEAEWVDRDKDGVRETLESLGDAIFFETGETGLCAALNRWVAHARVYQDTTVFRYWRPGPDGLPEFVDGNWSDYTAASIPTDGEGRLLISSPEELALLAKNVNAGTNYRGQTILLTRNLDLGDHLWTPIGTRNSSGGNKKQFSGTFNGQGYTISNMNAVGETNVGLFGMVEYGTIRNLTVRDGTVSASKGYNGGVAAVLNGSSSEEYRATVDNCSYGGMVASGSSYAGGIVGRMESAYGTISNCVNTGRIFSKAHTNIGGIVGELKDTAENCYNLGTVVAGDEFNRYVPKTLLNTSVGGIAGGVQGTAMSGAAGSKVINCYDGGPESNRGVIGSDSGYKKDSVQDCYYRTADGFVGVGVTIQLEPEPAAAMLSLDEPSEEVRLFDTGTVTLKGGAKLKSALSAVAADAGYLDWDQAEGANDGLPFFAQFARGTGTKSDPYIIQTQEQLFYLGSCVMGNTPAASFENAYVRLETDVTLNGGSFTADGRWLDENGNFRSHSESGATFEMEATPWEPIGDPTHPFAGTLDGNGHTISGLYGVNGGLFGNLTGTVKNLILADGYVEEGTNAFAGNDGGTVTNCGSTCQGTYGGISGDACWDRTTPKTLAALAEEQQASAEDGLLPWYDHPGQTGRHFFTPFYLTLNYDLDGGSHPGIPVLQVVWGGGLEDVRLPSREGYTFVGWDISEDGASEPTAQLVRDVDTRTLAEKTVILELKARWGTAAAIPGNYRLDDGTLAAVMEAPGSRAYLARYSALPGGGLKLEAVTGQPVRGGVCAVPLRDEQWSQGIWKIIAVPAAFFPAAD